jgi:hypothetical protein
LRSWGGGGRCYRVGEKMVGFRSHLGTGGEMY